MIFLTADCKCLSRFIYDDVLTACNTAFAHSSCNYCSVGCHTTARCEDTFSSNHSRKILRAGLFSDENDLEMSSEHFQFRGQYILTSVRSGLMIVEQHRAHVRILYEQYMKQMETHSATTQGLLFPEMVQFPPSDAHLVDQISDTLSALGFDFCPGLRYLAAGRRQFLHPGHPERARWCRCCVAAHTDGGGGARGTPRPRLAA